MIFLINGKNMAITDLIQNEVKKSLGRLKDKYPKLITDKHKAKVEIRYIDDKKIYRVSVNMDLENHHHLHADTFNKDLFLAIKEILAPLVSQLEKIKTRKLNAHNGVKVFKINNEDKFDDDNDTEFLE